MILWLINLFRSKVGLLLPATQTDEPPKRQVPEAKPVHSSRVTTTEIVLPSHTDIRGYVYGGVVLGWIDIAAGMAAKKHAVNPCVTRSVDAVHFMHPIRSGEFLFIQASVNRAWTTSMEVGVRVETEIPLTGKRKYCCHAYLTFVALDPNKQRSQEAPQNRNPTVRVPRIIPTTSIESERFNMAEQRRRARIGPGNTDKKGNQNENGMAELRELMQEWSRYTNTESMSNAEIPVLLQEPDEYDSDGTATEKDPGRLYFKRRRSTLSGQVLPQPDSKAVSESFAEVMITVLPQHANTLRITFGGQIMRWMEQCSLISATRHARRLMLMTSIDSLQFIKPTYVGDCVIVRSIVTAGFHSIIEVYVTVEAENLLTGERYFTNDGFFTFIAIDFTDTPTPVPNVVFDREELRVVCDAAETRRKKRIQQRRDLVQKELSLSPDEFLQFSE